MAKMGSFGFNDAKDRQVKKANGANWLAFWLSLVLPIVLNHHPMTSFLQQQTLSPLRPLRKKKRGKEKGNLIIPFNQKKKKRAKSRTKKWRLLYSSGEAAALSTSSSISSKWKEGKKKHVPQFYSISSGSRFLYVIVGRDQQSQFKRPNTNTHTPSFPSRETFSRVPLKNKEE